MSIAELLGPTSDEGFVLDARGVGLRRLLADLWRSRTLIATLARRDFFVSYRRTTLGLVWAVGLPLFQALVLTVVFSRIVRIHTEVPYGAFVVAGFVPWTYFNATVMGASGAIRGNAGLANRIYFPRAVLPLVTIGSNLYSYAINVVILVVICLVLGVHLGAALLLLVPATLLMLVLGGSLSLVCSVLEVYFRDLRFLLTAAFTVWLYVTPILYPLDLAPHALRQLLRVNPATGMVELFRAATVGADGDWLPSVGIAVVVSAVLGVAAVLLHRRHDRLLTDLL